MDTHAIVFFTSSKTAAIVALSAINGGHRVNATVKVRWNKKIYLAKIVHISSKDECEKKIGDVTGDGKLVERFFTIGESSVTPQDGINTGKESNNGTTETMEQIKAGMFELMEQMMQMKRFMAGGFHDVVRRIRYALHKKMSRT
ncbi:unnamed protein product [Haemonchus placei]|uniref:RNA-binding protein n=1 Tax=Haemonchus placei TaxID=6290 RepID=A0A0N4X9C9_HAEPC|nr:unnamed protein product [Haemonchus placei]